MMLPSRHYISYHTQFMRELFAQRPDLAREQQQGRAIWWDKRPEELARRRERDEGCVAQGAYVYYNP